MKKIYVYLLTGFIIIALVIVSINYKAWIKSLSSNLPANNSAAKQSSSSTLNPQITLPGWHSLVNEEQGYALQYPDNVNVKTNGKSALSSINEDQKTQLEFPLIYISVLSDIAVRDASVYNYVSNSDVKKVVEANIDQKITFTNSDPEYNTFKKIGNVKVAGKDTFIVENDKVWEAKPGIKDRRAFIVNSKTVYMIGSYYETSEQLATFNQVLNTLNIQ